MITEDEFLITDGNLRILELLPHMMKDKKYRRKLRQITIEFMGEMAI